MKKIPFILVLISIIVPMLASCTTTHHGVSVINVPNINELYIRNAGTSNWIRISDIQDIDKSSFSNRVDIRVIDTNGVAYSKFNVPFDDAVFAETNREKYSGKGTFAAELFFALILVGGAITWIAMTGLPETDKEKTQ